MNFHFDFHYNEKPSRTYRDTYSEGRRFTGFRTMEIGSFTCGFVQKKMPDISNQETNAARKQGPKERTTRDLLHTIFRERINLNLEFMFMKHYAPNRCEPSIEALNFGGGGGGGQGRCERRSEVFVKIQKIFFLGGEGGGLGVSG